LQFYRAVSLILSVLAFGFSMINLHSGYQGSQQLLGQSTVPGNTTNKVVMINFDDNRIGQFTVAKPILDKYGFKATFYAVCNYLDNTKKGYMNWTQLETLYKEGHDIGSHTMDHKNLGDSSINSLNYQIGKSKKCLEDHGIKVTSFAYPFNQGSDNKTVVKIVSKYYDFARTASSPLTFLKCDGWKVKSNQTNCATYDPKGNLTYGNRYSIRGWSHDLSRLVNLYTDDQLYDRFLDVVNGQTAFNRNGTIDAIPIVIFHKAGDETGDYVTDPRLFDKEMKYLYDNHFRVLTMRDLGYDTRTNDLYIK